jgi:hypothetical protein
VDDLQRLDQVHSGGQPGMLQLSPQKPQQPSITGKGPGAGAPTTAKRTVKGSPARAHRQKAQSPAKLPQQQRQEVRHASPTPNSKQVQSRRCVCECVCVRRHSWWSGSVGQLVGLQC